MLRTIGKENPMKVTPSDLRKYTYTTGAYVVPFYDGKQWRWVVSSFGDDTYCDGQVIDPRETADEIFGLVHPDNLTSNDGDDTMEVGE